MSGVGPKICISNRVPDDAHRRTTLCHKVLEDPETARGGGATVSVPQVGSGSNESFCHPCSPASRSKGQGQAPRTPGISLAAQPDLAPVGVKASERPHTLSRRALKLGTQGRGGFLQIKAGSPAFDSKTSTLFGGCPEFGAGWLSLGPGVSGQRPRLAVFLHNSLAA